MQSYPKITALKNKTLILLALGVLIYGYSNKQLSGNRSEPEPDVQVESVYSDRDTSTPAPEVSTAVASWYDRSACANRIYGVSCKTANGEIFDETKYTLACSSAFRLGSRFKFCYLDKCVSAICSDRGNFKRLNREFDFSPATFGALADLDKGIIKIRWELIK